MKKFNERIIYNSYDVDDTDELLSMLEWDETAADLSDFLRGSLWLFTGTIQRWNGQAAGGFIFESMDELYRAWMDCDYFKIYDVYGHLYIDCSHHDGTNHFEIKRITERGEKYIDNHPNMTDRELHGKLWNNSAYTHLPHYINHIAN